jgi:hypothetical protein
MPANFEVYWPQFNYAAILYKYLQGVKTWLIFGVGILKFLCCGKLGLAFYWVFCWA